MRRVAARDEVERLVSDALRQQPVEHWLEQFAANGIPAGEVKTLDRVYASPQVRQQGLVVEVEHPTLGRIELPGPPLKFSGSGSVTHTAPPTLGQHTEQIRHEVAEEAGR